MRTTLHERTSMNQTAKGVAVLGAVSAMLATSLLAVGCTTDEGTLTLDDGQVAAGAARSGYGESAGGGVPAQDEGPASPSAVLDARTIDYASALRVASLKILGEVPSLARIKAFAAASDPKAFYEAEIDTMLADPRFATTQLRYWRNTFKTGGPNGDDGPSLEAAATFAAMTVVQDKPYTDLFTATSGTCPTFDPMTSTFTPGNCTSAAPTAGILSDAGLMAQYYAPMAFRRVRFIQEAFVCSKLPVEYSPQPQQFGAGIYTGPYPVTSIQGNLVDPEARIDFHDSESTLCVNCHVTLNHAAGLFANFDDKGAYDAAEPQVRLPDNSRVKMEDFLPAGEPFSWRFGKPVTDLVSYGQAMAQDPDVARCGVTRAWNYAFSRGNVVDDASPVPKAVSDSLLASFQNGFKVKPLLRAIFTSDDFVKF